MALSLTEVEHGLGQLIWNSTTYLVQLHEKSSDCLLSNWEKPNERTGLVPAIPAVLASIFQDSTDVLSWKAGCGPVMTLAHLSGYQYGFSFTMANYSHL